MCITKYNAGDDAWNATGLEEAKQLMLPTTITSVVAGSGSCSPSNRKFCCYINWKRHRRYNVM